VRDVEDTMPSDRRGSESVVVSWTGGKDGCYACYQAMAAGYDVTHLLNFRNLGKIGSHEINPGIVQGQAETIGIPLVQRDFFSYEQEFKEVVSELRARGARIDGAVFGHIATHKRLVDRICRDLEIDLVLPLWQRDPKKIITDIIDAGFEVIIVSARAGLMGSEWLGRRIDGEFIGELSEFNESIDPCGENGEFHTLVTDGPIFDQRISIARSERVLRDDYWFLNISEFAYEKKEPRPYRR
jgi:diphthine-ammonia ligase